MKTVQNVYNIYTSMDSEKQSITTLTGVNDVYNNITRFTKKREDANKILSAFVFENGLGSAYYNLTPKEVLTLDNLLDISTNYVIENRDEMPFVLLKIREKHINNILDYLSTLKYDQNLNFDFYKNTLNNGNALLYAISIFKSLYGINGLSSDYKQEMISMVNLLTPKEEKVSSLSKEENSRYLTCLSNKVLISTLQSEELWYYENLFETYKNLSANPYFNDVDYLIFASIYLFYYSHRDVDELFKEQIDSLSKEYAEIFRSKVLWKYKRSYSFNDYLNLLKKLLDYYKNIDLVSFWYSVPKSEKGQMIFSPIYIIYWWVSLLFMGAATITDKYEEELKKVLDEEELSYFVSAISDYNKEDKTLFDEINEYFTLIGNNPSPKNSSLVDYYYLSKFKTLVDSQENKRHVEAFLNSPVSGGNYYGTLKDNLDTQIKTFPFYSGECKDNINHKNWNTHYFGDVVETENMRLHFYDQLREIIFNDFEETYSSNREAKVDPILFKNLLYNYESDGDNANQKIFKGQDGKEYSYNKDNKDALKVYISISDKTMCREPNDIEINKIIEDSYRPKDGLYVFNLSSSSVPNVYVTREDLIKLIKKYYCYVAIDINYSIEYSDFDKMFTCIKTNDINHSQVDESKTNEPTGQSSSENKLAEDKLNGHKINDSKSEKPSRKSNGNNDTDSKKS